MSEELGEMWKFAIKGIPDLPEDGLGPPKEESIRKEPLKDGETPVQVQKIITEVYVYTSLNDNDMWYGSKTFQDVQFLGEMRLADVVQLLQNKNKKKRR